MYCYKITLSLWTAPIIADGKFSRMARRFSSICKRPWELFLEASILHFIGSGRTDAGVHALNQVAHFKTGHYFTSNGLLLALNGLLPRDIRIKRVESVPLDFHSQYSAISKEYHYHLFLERVMDPFRRLYAWHVLRKIDQPLLEEGASLFVGTHDFTSFANEGHEGSASRERQNHLSLGYLSGRGRAAA